MYSGQGSALPSFAIRLNHRRPTWLPFLFVECDKSMNNRHIMATYARKPVSFERGEGVWLYPGKSREDRYLDALSGLAVCGLGHAHPAVSAAVSDQCTRLLHTSNLYGITLQEELAARLCDLSGMDAAFFCNSGAEANEAAIKLARLYAHSRQVQHPVILVTENSFHGRTMATLTATGNPAVHTGYEPLVPGFIRVPYDDADAMQTALSDNPEAVAVLIEPIQCEGGICIPTPGFLAELRRLCDRHAALLMLDEVQTGTGRTGKWFCFQHEGILPDVLVTAKGLANGVPIGACLARESVASLFTPGSHGSTFGGNPLACRAALATLDTIEANDLRAHAKRLGEYMLDSLQERLSDVGCVQEIRGMGLIIGVELAQPCGQVADLCLENKLLVNVTAERVIRLLPPLILEKMHADQIVDILVRCILEFAGSPVKRPEDRHA